MALWLKILATITQQRKFIEAGPVAAWLWIGGVGHCRQTNTDGFIPKLVVPGLVPGLKSPYKHAARLVEVGLWHDAVGGYQVNDYLDWNPSKDEIDELHRKDRDRKRSKQSADPESDRNPIGIRSEAPRIRARGTRAGVSSPSALNGSGSEDLPEESARETTPRGLIDGRDVRAHGEHAWCDFERRLCVTRRLHADFLSRLGMADADARLRAWYPTVITRYAGQPIGDDVFAFWRNAFAAWVGTVTQKPQEASGKGHAVAQGVARGLAHYAARKAQEGGA